MRKLIMTSFIMMNMAGFTAFGDNIQSTTLAPPGGGRNIASEDAQTGANYTDQVEAERAADEAKHSEARRFHEKMLNKVQKIR